MTGHSVCKVNDHFAKMLVIVHIDQPARSTAQANTMMQNNSQSASHSCACVTALLGCSGVWWNSSTVRMWWGLQFVSFFLEFPHMTWLQEHDFFDWSKWHVSDECANHSVHIQIVALRHIWTSLHMTFHASWISRVGISLKKQSSPCSVWWLTRTIIPTACL